MNLAYRKWRSLLFRIRYLREMIMDRVKGVDFTAPMDKKEAGTSGQDQALYYASSGYVPEIDMALKYLRISPADAIIDYGCGKGAVLVKFAQYPFAKVAGLELSEQLSTICRKNMTKLGLNAVEVLTVDATVFKSIDLFTCFYFFNPFTGQVFRSVIANIVDSWERQPRMLHLIYYHPKCHEDVMATDRFSLVKVFTDGARRLHIYQIKSKNINVN